MEFVSRHSRTICGSRATSPSMLNTPSVTTHRVALAE
jgi:hypothetical protein